MSADDDTLAKARRYVEERRPIVWEQKGRIARFAGFDTLDAERTLGLLEANLKVFVKEHRRSLERNEQQAHESPPPSVAFGMINVRRASHFSAFAFEIGE